MWTVVVTAIIVLVIGCAVALSAGIPSQALPRIGYALHVSACVLTGALALVGMGPAWADSGPFALLLVGVPVVLSAGSLAMTGHGHLTTAVIWVAAVLMLGWTLLTALGAGVFSLAPPILMFAAATASTLGSRTPATMGHSHVS